MLKLRNVTNSGTEFAYYDFETFQRVDRAVQNQINFVYSTIPIIFLLLFLTLYTVVWEKKRSRIVILILIQWNWILLSAFVSQWSLLWSPSQAISECEIVGTATLILYSAAHLIFYLVLFERSKSTAVLVSPELTAKFQTLKTIMMYLTYFSFGVVCTIPIVQFQLIVLPSDTLRYTEDSERNSTGYCFTFTLASVAALFGVTDVMLSVGYLLLFIVPLKTSMAKLASVKVLNGAPGMPTSSDGDAEVKQLRKIATRNMVLSSCQMTISAVCYAVLAVSIAQIHETPWSAVTALRVCVIDLLGVTITTCLLTQAWIPQKLKSWVRRRSTKVHNLTTGTQGLSEGWSVAT